jgi:sterol 3beta-glucosyltransferase
MKSNRKILIVCFGTRGDNAPAIILGTDLQQVGYDVAFVTTQDHKALLERAGIHQYFLVPVSMQDMLQNVPKLVKQATNIPKFLQEARDSLLAPVIEGLIQLTQEAIESFRPDAVVSNAVADFMIRQLTEHHGLTTMRVDPYHLAEPALGDERILPLVMPDLFPNWFPKLIFRQSHRLFDGIMWRLIGAESNRVTSKMLGRAIPRVTYNQARKRDPLHIYAVSKYLLVKDRKLSLPASIQMVGFFYPPARPDSIPHELAQFIEGHRAANRPVLAACFGSMYMDPHETTSIVVQAAREARAALILIGGAGELIQDSQIWQENTGDVIYVPEVPFIDLFPCIDGAITHAGSGVAAHLFVSGTPFVGISYVVDQARWVDKGKRHGVCPGAIPRMKLSTARLTNAIQCILRPDTRENARCLSQHMEKDGVKTATALITSVLDHRATQHL